MLSKENAEKLKNTPITERFVKSPEGQEAIEEGTWDFFKDYYSHYVPKD